MKDKNIISLPDLNDDEEYIIGTGKKKKTQHKPSFTMTGDKMKSLDIIADFSKPEAFAFKLLKNNREWNTNIATFSTSSLSSTEKVVFSKGYKMLNEKNLVIRTRKGAVSSYLFNPDFIIPNDYSDALVMWREKKPV